MVVFPAYPGQGTMLLVRFSDPTVAMDSLLSDSIATLSTDMKRAEMEVRRPRGKGELVSVEGSALINSE